MKHPRDWGYLRCHLTAGAIVVSVAVLIRLILGWPA